MKKIIVVGGGAAGLMAAVSAAEGGAQVTVLEKMAAVGRKLLITGKGRCNVTNVADIPTLIKNMPGNGAFLYSAFHAFNNEQLIEFLARQQVPTKVERGGRVFPQSDKAADVIQGFTRALAGRNVAILTSQAVKAVLAPDGAVTGVVTRQDQEYPADAVILATGGASYPGTGSSGDGYGMAQKLGHTIMPLKPSLVPLEVEERWITELQGLSLKNVRATVRHKERTVAAEFGEMLFTHYGLSGPIILSLSKYVSELLEKPVCDLEAETVQKGPDARKTEKARADSTFERVRQARSRRSDNADGRFSTVSVEINLKPALTPEVLDKRIQRDFEKFSRKQIKNSLGELLPAKLIPVVIDLAYLDPDKPVHQIAKAERIRLLETITRLTFTIKGTRPISEAIVTAGGVYIKEINPKTMESKLIRNLYFAGEVIDIDGYTGGYNLQAAFSTGYVAGRSAAIGEHS